MRISDWSSDVCSSDLEFQLDPALTRVKAVLKVVRNGNHSRPLRLDGDGLVPLAVKVDGSARDENGWTLQAGALVIELPGDAHEIETLVELCPQANKIGRAHV